MVAMVSSMSGQIRTAKPEYWRAVWRVSELMLGAKIRVRVVILVYMESSLLPLAGRRVKSRDFKKDFSAAVVVLSIWKYMSLISCWCFNMACRLLMKTSCLRASTRVTPRQTIRLMS